MDYGFNGHEDSLVIPIQGRMTHSDYKGFRDILARINADQPPRIIFDLARVEFMDSSALGMLLIVRDAAVQNRHDVVLRGGTGQVERLIAIGKLHKYFIIE
jgi:HptB-dependent secretion and biofilm anti anti-sigma factor